MSDWFVPTAPARLKPTPWLSGKATAYLESLLTPDMIVLEHGAGGSTLWLAERVKQVVSFESKPEWYEVLSKRIPQNVTLLLGKGVPPLVPVDLLFIDGEPVADRAYWLEHAPQLVKPGGCLVLDNANRPEYAEAREKMRTVFSHLETVNSNSGGFLYLVTEFYRL